MADRTTGTSHPRVSGRSCSGCPTATSGQETRYQTNSNFQATATSNEGRQMEWARFSLRSLECIMFIKLIDIYEKEEQCVLILIFPAMAQIKSNPSRLKVVAPVIEG